MNGPMYLLSLCATSMRIMCACTTKFFFIGTFNAHLVMPFVTCACHIKSSFIHFDALTHSRDDWCCTCSIHLISCLSYSPLISIYIMTACGHRIVVQSGCVYRRVLPRGHP